VISERILETVAMTIIGDSALCVVSPQRHISLWLSGPGWWERTWRPFVRHPALTRALGVFGLGFGLWLATKAESGSIHSRPYSRARRAREALSS
jgi:hypothetical protein